MTHHVMTQMGDKFPNMIGVKPGELDEKVRASLLPGYMTMGTDGMGDMATMHMKMPPNSLPMKGAPGPFDVIDMSGLLTVLKVREGVTSYEDPGWYQNPPGTVASLATADQLRHDGVEVPASKERTPSEHHHHPG
jgi:manganese oxidase